MRHRAAIAAAALCACVAPTRRATAAMVSRGEEVARTFCYACHDGDEAPRATNPLRPKLRPERWATPEQAYANIGQLAQLNPSMILAFEGSEDDRRALAAYVSDLSRRNRPPAWRLPLGLGALAAMVAAAAAWARRRC
jgi:mono/diheme cytochrome c family protein